MTGAARPVPSRALRYGAGTSALVLLLCAPVGAASAWTLGTVGAEVSAATARAHGEVVAVADSSAEIRWRVPGESTDRIDRVRLAAPAPPPGTRTEIAYDPAAPDLVLVPGSATLATVDRAASGATFSALLAAAVLATLVWQQTTRRRLARTPPVPAPVRRVRVQSGLLTRSWLELESDPQRWIPVHPDTVLATLPAPATVLLHGDPHRDRLVAAEIGGVLLPPSGFVRASEPRGRRTDSPARPDPDAAPPAAAWSVPGRLRADAALAVPAPLVGLMWAYLDGGGVLTWACATALAAALAFWWAALRGSDPS